MLKKEPSDIEILEQAFGAVGAEKEIGLKDNNLMIAFKVGEKYVRKVKKGLAIIWKRIKPFFIGDNIVDANIYFKDEYIVLVYTYKTKKDAQEAYEIFKKAADNASADHSPEIRGLPDKAVV